MRISEAKLCRSFPEKFVNIKFGEGVAGKKTIQLSKIEHILWNIFWPIFFKLSKKGTFHGQADRKRRTGTLLQFETMDDKVVCCEELGFSEGSSI